MQDILSTISDFVWGPFLLIPLLLLTGLYLTIVLPLLTITGSVLAGGQPLVFGGDHLISLPVLRSLRETRRPKI